MNHQRSQQPLGVGEVTKIGIIGCGICGAYLSWKLSKNHDVTVFDSKKKIGGKVCSGLVSERLWNFIPMNKKLIKNKIDKMHLHFKNRDITLDLDPDMFVIDRDELDRYVLSLGKAKLMLNTVVKEIIRGDKPKIVTNRGTFEFDYIIGADGARSFVRKSLKLKEPEFKMGLFVYAKEKNMSDIVDIWPTKGGFAWKIPRGHNAEYGIFENPAVATKEFKKFYKKGGKVYASLIPQGLVTSNDKRIALCGDASGLTKPWSIDGDESVLVMEDGLLKNRRIKDIVNEHNEKLKAFTPSCDLKNMGFFKVNAFLKHNISESLYEINLAKGFRIKTTSSHSVMIAEDFSLKEKKVADLSKNKDYIPIIIKIPKNEVITEINLISFIVKQAPELIKNIKVKGGKKLLYKSQKAAPIASYWKNDSIPLKLFLDKNIALKDVKISYDPSGGLWIPNIIKITPEFCRLLGYYIAEGDASGGRQLHLSFGMNDLKKGVVEDAILCIRKAFGISPSKIMFTETSTAEMVFGGKLLAKLFIDALQTGTGAKNKEIPYIIFNISGEMKMEFLKAYARGDGTNRIRTPENKRNRSIEVSVKTASRKLASDVIILSFQLALFPSIENECAKDHHYKDKIIKSSESYKIVYSRKADIERFSELFSDSEQLKKYLSEAGSDRATINLPKEMMPKDLMLKIGDKTLRKYFLQQKNARHCKSFSYDMVSKALRYFDINDRRVAFIKNAIDNGVIFLPVKDVRTVKANKKVYDLAINDTNMFVGGVGPMVLHNSGGGVIWTLHSADILVKTFPDFDKYNTELRKFFDPMIFFSKLTARIGTAIGDVFPWIVPKKVAFDSDWIF